MKIIDNQTETLKENLISTIESGSKLSIAASCFSMYAFNELMEQLQSVDELRFVFTTPTFVKKATGKQNARASSDDSGADSLIGSSFESQLRNALMQKAIARECAEWIKNEKISFRSVASNEPLSGYAVVQSADRKSAHVYTPLQGFTTVELGSSENKDILNLIQELDTPFAKQYLALFDAVWKDKKRLVDVKEELIKSISAICTENSPEFVYYVALYNIFNDFLNDISDDDFSANERVGYQNSVVWTKLYDFQRDAALAIINKLERYNGCILADSVGLGKTYTSLAVIKYYESRNKSVLVLCPKKLSDNWLGFRGNLINNPLVKDRFRYDVFYHTDMSRITAGAKTNGVDLSHINWENYDLVVIDESHNFRNGGNLNDKKMNRYQTLLEKVIRPGVKTRVLMLSATPVNNRFNDLRNQLALAYEDGDPSILESRLPTNNTIDGIFRKAQQAFNTWSKLEPAQRTTDRLIKELDFDFFELLDSVTIARSRKHIQSYYDMNAIGAFPKRLAPLSVSPTLTDLSDVADYDEIFDSLLNLWLTIYTPSHYIKKDRRHLYAEQFGDKLNNHGLSQENREQGLRRLMAINLMKRLESSICSFRLTLERIEKLISDTIHKIDDYYANKTNAFAEENYWDIEDEEMQEDIFHVGKKIQIHFKDMELDEWRKTLHADLLEIQSLRAKVSVITASHDSKLKELMQIIRNKVSNPINADNKKILIFTAFADTANYLYQNICGFAQSLGLNTAMVTGTTDGLSTIKGLHCDFNTILTCFSPRSKDRDNLHYDSIAATANIDILIGTDCISEGQNLQDCDYCINYDIHWNPVRIIQRYGRIDRIGSTNTVIQLVNFWPDVSLDDYINLKQRVETRMKIVNITATPEEQVLSDEEKVDLEYRKAQLEKLKSEVMDIEDMSSGISITDLGLNEFKLDLLDYTKTNRIEKKARRGAYAVVPATSTCPKGMIWVLKNISMRTNIKTPNRLHPYYLVYITDTGKIKCNYLNPKEVLSIMKLLCKGADTPHHNLCRMLDTETKHGKDMSKYSSLLNQTIQSIVETKKEADIQGLFKSGGTALTKRDRIEGLDDFELICFLVIK